MTRERRKQKRKFIKKMRNKNSPYRYAEDAQSSIFWGAFGTTIIIGMVVQWIR